MHLKFFFWDLQRTLISTNIVKQRCSLFDYCTGTNVWGVYATFPSIKYFEKLCGHEWGKLARHQTLWNYHVYLFWKDEKFFFYSLKCIYSYFLGFDEDINN